MAEFDDKLNSLLSDPNAMDQIMKMAQSLMGGMQSAPPPDSGDGASAPPGPQGAGGRDTAPAGAVLGGEQPVGGDAGLFSGLGSIDPGTLAALLPILRELGGSQNSSARQLLLALRPYLKPERQDKVERALQLARLFRVGKRFLLKGDGHV